MISERGGRADNTKGPDIGLGDKNFKIPVINMFEEQKETMFKNRRKYDCSGL